MSAATEMQAALIEALGAVADLTGVYDGPPARAAYPYAAIGEAVSGDWSTKDARGRELRLAVTIHDDGASPARLHGLMAAAEDAIEAIPRDLPTHRIASLVFLRGRIIRDAAGPWAGLIEYRARLLER